MLSVLIDSFIIIKKWNFFQFEVWFQSEFQEYCGDVKLVFSADVDRTVNERYENNNEIDIPVTIHCPNGRSFMVANRKLKHNKVFWINLTNYMWIRLCFSDTLKIRDVDIKLPDRLWAERTSYASVSYEVQAMTMDQPGPSLSVPSYFIRVSQLRRENILKFCYITPL